MASFSGVAYTVAPWIHMAMENMVTIMQNAHCSQQKVAQYVLQKSPCWRLAACRPLFCQALVARTVPSHSQTGSSHICNVLCTFAPCKPCNSDSKAPEAQTCREPACTFQMFQRHLSIACLCWPETSPFEARVERKRYCKVLKAFEPDFSDLACV